jgi:hypothetical protein
MENKRSALHCEDELADLVCLSRSILADNRTPVGSAEIIYAFSSNTRTSVLTHRCLLPAPVQPLKMVDKSTSPLQTHVGPVFCDEAVQTGLLFPE